MKHLIHAALFLAILMRLSAANPVAYTSLGAQDFLATYNPAGETFSKRLSVAQNAKVFALSPDGQTAFVANQGVRAISIATGNQIWNEPAGFVSHLAVSADGSEVYAITATFLLALNSATGQIVGETQVSGRDYPTYVASNGSNIFLSVVPGIFVIDRSTFGIVRQIGGVGENPDLAVSPDGTRLYASEHNGPNLGFVIDTGKNQVIATLGSSSYTSSSSVVVSPDGTAAYFATNQGLVEVDTATNTVTRTIASSPLTSAVPLATDGAHVYYSGGGAQQPVYALPALLQFDLEAGTYGSVPVGGAVLGIQVALPDNNVYILETLNTAETSDPDTGKITSHLGVVNATKYLTLSGNGNAVVGISASTRETASGLLTNQEEIGVISTASHTFRQFNIAVDGIGRFAVNADATLAYVVSSSADESLFFEIDKVDLTNGAIDGTISPSQFNGLQNEFLALSPDGLTLYILGSGTLCRVDIPSSTVSLCGHTGALYASSAGYPGRTLAISGDGNHLYILTNAKNLQEYDASTLALTRTVTYTSDGAGSPAPTLTYSAAANSAYVGYANNQAEVTTYAISRISLANFQVAATQPVDFEVLDIAASPDGSQLLAAGSPAGTAVFDAGTLKPTLTIPTGLTQSVTVATQ